MFELGVIYDIYDKATCWDRQWNTNIKMCTDFSELDFIPKTHKRPNGLSVNMVHFVAFLNSFQKFKNLKILPNDYWQLKE